jgi:PAS domain S-box-containing protein
MKKRSSNKDQLAKLMGFGETSMRKSYYPELQERIDELDDEKKRYKSIFENALNGICKLDASGRLIDINTYMANLCGCPTPEAFLAKTTNFIDEIGIAADEWSSLVEQLESSGKVEGYETALTCNHGKKVFVLMNLRKDNTLESPFTLDMYIQDITTLKSYQNDMSLMQNYLKDVINSMPSSMITLDEARKITNINTGFFSMFQLQEQDYTSQVLETAFPMFASYIPDINWSMDKNQTKTIEHIVFLVKDEKRVFNLVLYPLTQEKGCVVRIDDITERVQIDEMLIQTEKMFSLGNMAAGIAHEINNPLAGILQNAQVIQRRLDFRARQNQQIAQRINADINKLSEFLKIRKIDAMVEGIVSSCRRAAVIVEDLLSFSRKSHSKAETLNIIDVLEKSLDLAKKDYDLKTNYDFKKVEILTQYEDNLDPIFGEGSKLQQVFLNILANGAHAMHQFTDTPRIQIQVHQVKKQILIEIEDNGPGMDEKTASRIFNPFFTTKPVGVGTGLGLSVSYFIIVNDHGGSIHVESTEQGGARFIISLPISQKSSH